MHNALRTIAIHAASAGLQVAVIALTLVSTAAINNSMAEANCRDAAAQALISADHCALR
jgi:hypothetical protein